MSSFDVTIDVTSMSSFDVATGFYNKAEMQTCSIVQAAKINEKP